MKLSRSCLDQVVPRVRLVEMDEQEGRLQKVVERFFEVHQEDPRMVQQDGRSIPWAVFYHERMKEWLEKIAPEAGEPLRLAACCQHIRRWRIPRASYPEGKLGYKKWRHDLAVFHGDEAAAVLEEQGYSEETVQRVRELLLKVNLKSDPDVQVMEDVACLVFLENEFVSFAAKHEEEKIVAILRKTWKKMSPKGHDEALKLVVQLPEDLRAIIMRALE